jgi:hypothetical protein
VESEKADAPDDQQDDSDDIKNISHGLVVYGLINRSGNPG